MTSMEKFMLGKQSILLKNDLKNTVAIEQNVDAKNAHYIQQ